MTTNFTMTEPMKVRSWSRRIALIFL